MRNNNHYSLQVDWGHCDPAGIVLYPNFYRWMDRGFWMLFKSRGLTFQSMKSQFGSFGGPLVDTGASFLAPARMGDQLTVSSQIDHWGQKSFRIAHQFSRGDTRISNGFEVRVWGIKDDNDNLRASVIPEGVKNLFE